MSALELIARLRSAGVRLSVHDGKIKLKAEKGALTESLRQEITAHKDDIIALLGAGQETSGPKPERADRNQPLPLSFAQQRLWFLDELEPGTPVYNMPFALTVRGPLDETKLESALNQLVAQQESLRTVFAATESEPVQKILPELSLKLVREDLTDRADGAVTARLRELARTGFDLRTGPLLRFHSIRRSADETILLLVIHHIVSDLWSIDVLFERLGNLYAQALADVAPPVPALPLQYADYAVWQRELLSGTRLQRHLDYWLDQLADAPPVLDLPTDHQRPAEPGYRGKWQAITLQTDTARLLQNYAQHNNSGATLFMITFAAFVALLHKYSGATDLVVGTPISGRQHTEFEAIIGFFLNTLALRLETDPQGSFAELLARTRHCAVQAYAHQDLPFEKLVEELQPERDMSHTPVFQHMFIWQDSSGAPGKLGPLEAEPAVLISHDTAKFDLTLALTNAANGIEAGMEYNTDLFDAATIERMLGHYETLLRAVVTDPETKLSELSLLGEAEAERVVQEFNATDVEVIPACVHRLVEAQVERTPDTVAVRLGEDALTYAELNTKANALAQALREAGAGPATRVAIALDRSLELPVSALAVLKAGACYVPVDPHYPAERIKAMLDDSQPAVLLSHSALDVPAVASTITRLNVDQVDLQGEHGNLEAGDTPDDPTAPLYCIYTSGSTGTPKGVELSHAGLSNLIHWQNRHERLGSPALTLQFASFSFDVHFQEFFATWCNGGTTVMVDAELRQDLVRLADFIDTQRIERLYLPYAALQPIAETLVSHNSQPALKDIVVAGEQLQVSPAVRDLFGALNNAALHNQYGPSETHVVTALTLTGEPGDWPALPSIGTPVANTRAYVLDSAGRPCPVGIPGELYLGGVQVALGYRNRPGLNNTRFSDNPFVQGERLYRTGDRVRWLNNGELEFLGRADDQVKWRGFRIEPGEIEASLAAQPNVTQAVVLIREDTPGDKRLVAYVVGDNPDPLALTTALKGTLPDYMVPSVISVLDKLPLTPSGKVARRRLPVPEYSDDTPYVAPRNDTEQTLVKLWAEVLKLDPDTLSVHADFFSLGGHSLLATQLIARVRDHFGLSLPLKYIFRYPSPAELGATVTTLSAALAPTAAAETAQSTAGEDRDDFTI